MSERFVVTVTPGEREGMDKLVGAAAAAARVRRAQDELEDAQSVLQSAVWAAVREHRPSDVAEAVGRSRQWVHTLYTKEEALRC